MLERIAAYHAQMASQDWRLTSRHDVILMLCERGLQAVEKGPAPFTPPSPGVEEDNGMGDPPGQAALAKERHTPPLVSAPAAAAVAARRQFLSPAARRTFANDLLVACGLAD
jgi:hypothetical protein